MEKLPTTRTRSPKQMKRSSSPNYVMINGYIIDKRSSEDLLQVKTMELDNKPQRNDTSLDDSDIQDLEINVETLEDAIKRADENVQRFMQEISSTSTIQDHAKDIESTCEKSKNEVLDLSRFFSTIDEVSKNKIVDTLIDVYKSEILSGISKINEYQQIACAASAFKNESPRLQKVDETANDGSQYDPTDPIAARLGKSKAKIIIPSNQIIVEPSKYPEIDQNHQKSTEKNHSSLQTDFTVSYHTKSSPKPHFNYSNSTFPHSECERLQSPSHFEEFRKPDDPNLFIENENSDMIEFPANTTKVYANSRYNMGLPPPHFNVIPHSVFTPHFVPIM